MTESMRITHAALRQFVAALRTSYNADIKGRTVRDISRDITLEQRVQASRARLGFLVPLNKAMHSAIQQAGTGAVGGLKLYIKQFEQLDKLIRKEVDYHHEKYFGGEVGGLRILVPVEGVRIENWRVATFDEIVSQVQRQLDAERNAARQRAMTAEQARKAFVDSLDDDQRALLHQALDAALAKGTHSISVDHRDLAE